MSIVIMSGVPYSIEKSLEATSIAGATGIFITTGSIVVGTGGIGGAVVLASLASLGAGSSGSAVTALIVATLGNPGRDIVGTSRGRGDV